MHLVEDACFTFGKGRFTAAEVHQMSLLNLDGAYAGITTSERAAAEAHRSATPSQQA